MRGEREDGGPRVRRCEGGRTSVVRCTRSHVRGGLYIPIAIEKGERKEKEEKREGRDWWRRSRKGCSLCLSYFFLYCSVHTLFEYSCWGNI